MKPESRASWCGGYLVAGQGKSPASQQETANYLQTHLKPRCKTCASLLQVRNRPHPVCCNGEHHRAAKYTASLVNNKLRLVDWQLPVALQKNCCTPGEQPLALTQLEATNVRCKAPAVGEVAGLQNGSSDGQATHLTRLGLRATTEEATMSAAQRIQKALEALAPGSDWLVMATKSNRQDAIAYARRLQTGSFEAALVLPEHLEELTDELTGEERGGHFSSLVLRPEALKQLGVPCNVFPMSSAADAAQFMAECHRTACTQCDWRFPGAALEGGVCLHCYATLETVAPEEPCVVCQVEDKLELHGRLLVACLDCKKYTCIACRDKHGKVDRSLKCPACRGVMGIGGGAKVRLCWYE